MMIMPTQQNDKNATSTASPTVSPTPPEIVALTSQIEPLKHKAARLDTANIVALYAAGAIALAFAVVGFLNSRVNRDIRGLEDKLIRAKDAQLVRDLKDKDVLISDAQKSAGEATEKASGLEKQNIQLRKDLETATAESRTKQAELATEQRKLSEEQRKTAQAQREADVARLELQKHLEKVAARQEDRRLSKGFRPVREIVVDELDRGNLWQVTVQYKADDNEAFRFAKQIAAALLQAGWYLDNDPSPITKDDSIEPTLRAWVPNIRPGITIVIPQGLDAGTFKHTKAKVLGEDLTAAGFSPNVDAGFSDNPSFLVVIGSKP